MFRTRSLVAGAAFAIILAPLGVPSSASAAPAASPRIVHKVGTGSYKVTGTGSGQPKGFLHYTTVADASWRPTIASQWLVKMAITGRFAGEGSSACPPAPRSLTGAIYSRGLGETTAAPRAARGGPGSLRGRTARSARPSS